MAAHVLRRRVGERQRHDAHARRLAGADAGRIETESLLILDGADNVDVPGTHGSSSLPYDGTESLFAAYAERWASDSRARKRFAAPIGWCSWYYYFSNVTLADVVENMDWFAARRDDPEFGKVRS